MRAEVISVGTELILGLSSDTNFSFITKELLKIGVLCKRLNTVPDEIDEIRSCLGEVLKRADLLVITGGLGPTFDDLTRDAIAAALEKELKIDRNIEKKIKDKLSHFGHPVSKSILKQAYIPSGAYPIEPSIGTAPGFIVEDKTKIIAAFPGVPEEMKMMFPELIRYLTGKTGLIACKSSLRRLKIFGLPEAVVEDRLLKAKLLARKELKGIVVKRGIVEIELFREESGEEELERIERKLKDLFKKDIFGIDDEKMEDVTARLLIKKKKTVAVAESCSGGLTGSLLTNKPGSSKYFIGGVTSYSDQMKETILKVPSGIIEKHGAVSRYCALYMARGIREITGADIGIAVTGIAGPDGGTGKKPVGTVYLALVEGENEDVERLLLTGDREVIREKAALSALNKMRLYLVGEKT